MPSKHQKIIELTIELNETFEKYSGGIENYDAKESINKILNEITKLEKHDEVIFFCENTYKISNKLFSGKIIKKHDYLEIEKLKKHVKNEISKINKTVNKIFIMESNNVT